MIGYLRAAVSSWGTTAHPPVNGARVDALRAHQQRVLTDLAKNLDPSERQRMRHLLDDARFLESGRDD